MGPAGTHEEQRHRDAALWPHLSAPPSPSAEQSRQRRRGLPGAGQQRLHGHLEFFLLFVEAFCQSLPNQRRIGSVEAAVALASNCRQPRQLDVQD